MRDRRFPLAEAAAVLTIFSVAVAQHFYKSPEVSSTGTSVPIPTESDSLLEASFVQDDQGPKIEVVGEEANNQVPVLPIEDFCNALDASNTILPGDVDDCIAVVEDSYDSPDGYLKGPFTVYVSTVAGPNGPEVPMGESHVEVFDYVTNFDGVSYNVPADIPRSLRNTLINVASVVVGLSLVSGFVQWVLHGKKQD